MLAFITCRVHVFANQKSELLWFDVLVFGPSQVHAQVQG